MRQTRTIVIFTSVLTIFLFLANLVVYKALLLAFNISKSPLLILVLAICGVSFIASMIFTRRYDSPLIRIYYKLSMIWMGSFAYLFLASVIYILEFLSIGDPSRFFAVFLYALAIITSIYGVIHARKLIVKEVTIELPRLPVAWHHRKAIWISDVHIGHIHNNKFIERIIKKIKTLSPDIVFIGGDLFDGPTSKEIIEHIEPFRNFSVPLGIHFVTGNHEGYGDIKKFLAKINEVGINIIDDKNIVIDNMQILGVSFASTAKEPDFKNVLMSLAIDNNKHSILLKHEPKYVEVAESFGVSLHISGHTHKAQQWPFEYLGRLMYGKFEYGLQKLKNMYVYTSSGIGSAGPPMRVGTDGEIVVFTFKNIS